VPAFLPPVCATRKLYTANGYVDMIAVPQTSTSANAKINLTIDAVEGQQYRMRTLQLNGDPDLVAQLTPH
jgi:outer membrane protein assembly factor BamA